ncbi:hypothetical protein [Streptomyces albiflavescens]|uniref:hypothetical protein n=1 Tax=Streptomyces albiflavescens TaxID=1623582 RepID=UPI0016689224|nr:hypothetical protein [Streptomyces albiflavescens]
MAAVSARPTWTAPRGPANWAASTGGPWAASAGGTWPALDVAGAVDHLDDVAVLVIKRIDE